MISREEADLSPFASLSLLISNVFRVLYLDLATQTQNSRQTTRRDGSLYLAGEWRSLQWYPKVSNFSRRTVAITS